MPESVETPAPVSAVTRRPRSRPTASWTVPVHGAGPLPDGGGWLGRHASRDESVGTDAEPVVGRSPEPGAEPVAGAGVEEGVRPVAGAGVEEDVRPVAGADADGSGT